MPELSWCCCWGMGAKAQIASVLKKEAGVLWEVQGGSGVPVQSRGIHGGPGLWKGAEVGRVVGGDL